MLNEASSLNGKSSSELVVKSTRPKEYDALLPNFGASVVCSPATDRDVLETYPLIAETFGGAIAEIDRILEIANHNRLCVWAIRDAKSGAGLGCYALLFLNRSGADAALAGRLDGRDPNPEHLCAQNETPAAIYHWLVAAKGRAAAGIAHVTSFLCGPKFAEIDYLATAATPDGERFMRRVGFQPAGSGSGVFRYRRMANRQRMDS